MSRLVLACIIGVISSVLLLSPAFAQELPTYDIVVFGLSEDGETWITRTVEVPVDGYVEVDFNGCTVWLWGPEFDEDDLPAPAQNVLCKCSVHMKSKCRCTNWCAITENNKRREGTCI